MLATKESNIRGLVDSLRREGDQVKQCFTDDSVKAITGSAAAIGAIVGLFPNYPSTAWAGIPIAIWLMSVCRSGIYKYGTANRNFGYQLYLEKTADLVGQDDDPRTPLEHVRAASELSWKPWMRQLGWEEAVRAWRVVQARFFNTIYRTPSGRGFLLSELWSSLDPRLYRLTRSAECERDRYRKAKVGTKLARQEQPAGYPWFMLEDLTLVEDARGWRPAYAGGSYLRTVFFVLVLMQCVAITPLVLASVRYFARAIRFSISGAYGLQLEDALVALSQSALCASASCVMCALVWLRYVRVKRRRQMLESELVSIPSCAVMWQAVVVAHYRATRKCADTFEHYTEHLAAEASSLASNPFTIHRWIREEPS